MFLNLRIIEGRARVTALIYDWDEDNAFWDHTIALYDFLAITGDAGGCELFKNNFFLTTPHFIVNYYITLFDALLCDTDVNIIDIAL